MLLIIVTSEGDVQNRILHTDRAYSQAQLIEATNFFNQHYAGQPFGALRALLADELKSLREDIVGLMAAAVEVGRRRAARGRGARRHRREEPAVGRRPRVEHGPPAAALRPVRAEDLAPAPARRVAARAGRADLHRRRVGARAARRVQRRHRALRGRRPVIGTLGVIGPTRMAYERVIPIVDVTAKLLSNALTQQMND